MALFLITILVFIFVIFIMAIGVILGRKCIKGSCGGLGNCEGCLHQEQKKCAHYLMSPSGAETESGVESQEL